MQSYHWPNWQTRPAIITTYLDSFQSFYRFDLLCDCMYNYNIREGSFEAPLWKLSVVSESQGQGVEAGGWPAMGKRVTMMSARVMCRNMVRLRRLPRLLLNNPSSWQHSTLGTKWHTVGICKKFTLTLLNHSYLAMHWHYWHLTKVCNFLSQNILFTFLKKLGCSSWIVLWTWINVW